MPQTYVIARITHRQHRLHRCQLERVATSVPRSGRELLAAFVCAFLAGIATAADDPGAKALQQNQLQRQQQQDALQLRMQQQQQRATQAPPTDAHQQQAGRQLEIEQQQRQRELHYRQGLEPSTAQPIDDEGTRRAKAQLEQQRAQRESERQLQRFDREMRQQSDRRRKVGSPGEITTADPQ